MCQIDGCTNAARKRGWCEMHYQRWRKRGDPGGAARLRNPLPRSEEEAVERWWARVEVRGDNECWAWRGTCNQDGYGLFHSGEKDSKGRARTTTATRWIWVQVHGPIPPETPFVLHRCDNPPCVNIRHLFLGTQLDNMRDMLEKSRLGKRTRGATHP